jgi:hypothetical protein
MSTGAMFKAMLPAVAAAALALASSVAAGEALTDAEVRQVIIRESVNSYPGNCPCPWNADRAGRRCGKRSAYFRPGGYAPVCFAHEISDEQVRAFRESRQIEKL